jgi:hypothetical protein
MQDRFEENYGGSKIRIAYDKDKILFNLIDVAEAVGYAKVSSMRHHTQGKKREVNLADGIYLSVRTLNKVARDATRTPRVAFFADWAKGAADRVLVKIQNLVNPAPVVATTKFVSDQAMSIKGNPELHGIKDAASVLGMKTQELSDWLVAQGYAGRYVSNNALYWKQWFRDQGYGKRPIIKDDKGERESNVAKLTQRGLEYIQSRVDSQRDSNVLSFALKESSEREKLEKEIDDLIVQTFKPHEVRAYYSNLLGTAHKYEIHRHELIGSVKTILAQVKLKEKNNAV